MRIVYTEYQTIFFHTFSIFRISAIIPDTSVGRTIFLANALTDYFQQSIGIGNLIILWTKSTRKAVLDNHAHAFGKVIDIDKTLTYILVCTWNDRQHTGYCCKTSNILTTATLAIGTWRSHDGNVEYRFIIFC